MQGEVCRQIIHGNAPRMQTRSKARHPRRNGTLWAILIAFVFVVVMGIMHSDRWVSAGISHIASEFWFTPYVFFLHYSVQRSLKFGVNADLVDLLTCIFVGLLIGHLIVGRYYRWASREYGLTVSDPVQPPLIPSHATRVASHILGLLPLVCISIATMTCPSGLTGDWVITSRYQSWVIQYPYIVASFFGLLAAMMLIVMCVNRIALAGGIAAKPNRFYVAMLGVNVMAFSFYFAAGL